MNGTEFDNSYKRAEAPTFFLNAVVEGWKIGIPLIKENGSIKLIIPSGLGYGNEARFGIPANSILVFDIVLKNVL